MNIIFNIEGGIGKSVIGTAVCEAIRKQYPDDKLIVLTGYPDVFLGNPYVDKVIQHGSAPYFYQDFIDGQECKIMWHNPYQETAFVQRTEHLIETWCKMFGLEYNGEKPQLYMTKREMEFYTNKYAQSDKPIMVIQTNGGAANQPIKYSWHRDIPNEVVSEVVKKYAPAFNIVHIRREDQMSYPNTIPVQAGFREIVALISISKKRLFMDSFCQHVAAALELPSTVLWIGNDPKQFGYELHNNITANPETKKPELRHAFLSKYRIDGDPLEFPYNDSKEIFDVEKVVESIEKV
jgi:hypothetical protein